MMYQVKNKRLRSSEEDRRKRIDRLKETTGNHLPAYSMMNPNLGLDPMSLSGHIENYIGAVQVPTGIAGPLKINFKEGQESISAPISTTEGALVSSIHRGALALSLSGGATVRVIKNQMIRAPQFDFGSIDTALQFRDWLASQFAKLKSMVINRSQHAILTSIDAKVLGRIVHCRFIYTTGNAAGQNMTTFCTSYLCKYIQNEWEAFSGQPILDFHIEGNLSSDKKASFLSTLEGRGRSVFVEAVIKGKVIRKVLRTDPKTFVERYQRTKSAHFMSGFFGYNINVANVVAGLFLSTGQDMACVHESSIAEFNMENRSDSEDHDIYISLYMPVMVVGTVGGGTHLPLFQDNLSILKCLNREDGADRLAQIIASFALGLELSTVSAIGSNHFVEAHEKYGRSLSSSSLKMSDFNADFFKNHFTGENVIQLKKIDAENKQGYMTDMASQVSRKFSGLLAFEVQTDSYIKKTFLKIKPKDSEVVRGCARVLDSIQPGLSEQLIHQSPFLPFKNCHLREISVLAKKNKFITNLSPEYYGSFIDEQKEAFILIQEYIESDLIISEMNTESYMNQELKCELLKKMAQMYGHFLNQKEKAINICDLIYDFSNSENLNQQYDLWDALFCISYSKLETNYPILFKTYQKTLDHFDTLIHELKRLDHSLIHYDFNPRNLAFDLKSHKSYLFDWEFTSWGAPQRDLIEFILFTSRADQIQNDMTFYFEYLFLEINKNSEYQLDRNKWDTGIFLCLKEFIVKRLPFYFILNEVGFCSYLNPLLKNIEILCQHYESK